MSVLAKSEKRIHKERAMRRRERKNYGNACMRCRGKNSPRAIPPSFGNIISNSPRSSRPLRNSRVACPSVPFAISGTNALRLSNSPWNRSNCQPPIWNLISGAPTGSTKYSITSDSCQYRLTTAAHEEARLRPSAILALAVSKANMLDKALGN